MRDRFNIVDEEFTQAHVGFLLNRGEKGWTLSIYKSAVDKYFESAWKEELEQVAAEAISAASNAPSTSTPAADLIEDLEKAKNIRMVSLPLRQIVRSDLSAEDRSRIEQKLERAQSNMSEFMDDMSVGAYKSTLLVSLPPPSFF